MSSKLTTVAALLGADERTVRRAAQRGLIRGQRPSPRRWDLAADEFAYLREHWAMLRQLTEALRTEPTVALAVLYGSTARGDERADSDLDVLVSFRKDRASVTALAARLEGACGRAVDVARLSRVRREAPFLLLQALDEGRVLVDRDGVWPELQASRETIARAARRQMRRDEQQAADAVARFAETS